MRLFMNGHSVMVPLLVILHAFCALLFFEYLFSLYYLTSKVILKDLFLKLGCYD